MPEVTRRAFPVITESYDAMGTQRVLVVEADASSRSILEVSLKRAGFEVDIATTGREAMQQLMSQPLPAAVVMSTQLHGDDGYSLCAQLRAEPRTAKLKVLLLARADEDEKGTLAEVVGADDLLAKPAFARDVAALVVLWIAPRDESGACLLDTETLPIPVTLRALLSTQRAGQIQLSKRAFIAYRAGRVTHAEAEGLLGADALARLMTLGHGPYRVSFTIPTTPAMLDLPLKELVATSYPRLQKWEALAARSVPVDSRFQVDFAALAKALPNIPDAVNQVVRLFDGQRDVRKVLFDSPLNETVTLEVINRLHLMGIVQPASERSTSSEPRLAPRLFEPPAVEAQEQMNTLFGNADLQEAIITPATRIAAEDWWQPPAGTGLEGISSTDGWVEQQLSAFKIQQVVEPQDVPPVEPEVAAFTEGVLAAPEQTQLEQAIAPIQLTDVLPMAPPPTAQVAVRTVEDQFFAEDRGPGDAAAEEEGDEDTDPSVKTVPGPIEDTYRRPAAAPIPAAAVAPSAFAGDEPLDDEEALARVRPSGSKWVALSIAGALLIALLGVGLAQLFGESEPAFVPPPIVLPEPPPAEPVAPVVHLEVPPIQVSDEQVARAMAEATQQYEEAQFPEAIATLEQVVEVAPSSVEAWMLMGMARLDNSERVAAEEAAMTVLALDPNHADAFLLLATIHIRDGKRDVAAGEIARYLELEPNGKHADEAKKLLKR